MVYQEVHNYGEFGDNTKNKKNVPIATLSEITVPVGTTVADLNINIQVTRTNGQVVTIGAPAAGSTPFRVAVNGDENGKWFWSTERNNISNAYPQFGLWGADMTTNPDWYKSPSNSGVFRW